MDRPYPVITVNEKAERAIRSGHPWVYAAEVTAQDESALPGQIADVRSPKGRWLGAGFVGGASKIRVRLLSRNPNDRFDEAFFARRVRYALDYRRRVMGPDFADGCRLIFGEADGLPGLTVDRFGDVLCAEVLCLGTDRIKDMLFSLLVRELERTGDRVRVLYERSDSSLRDKEGLPKVSRFVPVPGLETAGDGRVLLRENGIVYDVDYVSGQKTGFFLDQKYNRRAAAELAPGLRVLDCFTHTGAFALNCAKAGAAHVTAVDVSGDAIRLAEENARRNGLADTMDFVTGDVFDLLTDWAARGRRDWDYIILDPPAFTKSGATVKNALRGYKEINLKALRLLPRGGYLATCSCSHFMTRDLFREMMASAAADADVRLLQIQERQQAPDHPILWGVPETDYLKFFLFQVV